MKKVLLFTMLVAVASLFTSCENPDIKLAQSLVGTWDGSNYFDGDEVDAKYQFFACDENNKGKFVEINHLSIFDEVDGIEYEMPYIAFVGGDYSVKNGYLVLSYDAESAGVYFNEDPIINYVNAYLTYDREKGEGIWTQENPEDVTEWFISTTTDDFEEDWAEMCKKFNTNNEEAMGFGNLKVDEKVMSYHTNDLGTLTYTRDEVDWFEQYPF